MWFITNKIAFRSIKLIKCKWYCLLLYGSFEINQRVMIYWNCCDRASHMLPSPARTAVRSQTCHPRVGSASNTTLTQFQFSDHIRCSGHNGTGKPVRGGVLSCSGRALTQVTHSWCRHGHNAPLSMRQAANGTAHSQSLYVTQKGQTSGGYG